MNIFSRFSPRTADNLASGLVFAVAAVVYFLTADSAVSYWDCPEYVVCGSRLEVGHPPGNPVWMLAMRVATSPFPPSSHAYVINLCSALFMALTAFLLARIIFYFAFHTLSRSFAGSDFSSGRFHAGLAAIVSVGGALSFAFCDSTWFSAVEAEVYAFSSFITALTIWISCLLSQAEDKGKRRRLLILIAYILGLSLGIHQLNLLVIPVISLIYLFNRHPHPGQTWRAWGAILLSFLIVALILVLLMPGTLSLIAFSELKAVNSLSLPLHSGLVASIALIFFILLFGIAIASRKSLNVIATPLWCLVFLLLGYSSFALILIRANAAPFMNEGVPSDIFALQRYIARDQYGSRPLFYGPTPFSRPMLAESLKQGDSLPSYSRYALRKEKAVMIPSLPSPHLHYRSGLLSHADSTRNLKLLKKNTPRYLLSDYTFSRINTPELDMWFPRITDGDPAKLQSYEAWAGMTQENMQRVRISTAFDSLGNAVGKMGADGIRTEDFSRRPTYLQHLRMFFSYQLYYMYFRYLLWNFAGRQNDFPSTGEIDHGNFITGFPTIDNAMLGRQDLMPPSASSRNPGRNVYFCIPFLFGIIGIFYLLRSGRLSRRVLAVITLFFLITGPAIVFYLNQSPGEPRERDYSFLSSFMAFSVWIAFGFVAVAKYISRLSRRKSLILASAAFPALAVPSLLFFENLDDHTRMGRSETSSFAASLLESVPDGIIFTYGDNFTFPLWYAREVEGLSPHASIIDVSYLSLPEYIINLSKQGRNAVALTASPSDIAFGAYTFTTIAPDADTSPTDLYEALRELYANKSGQPSLGHSIVRIPGASSSDSILIDLRKIYRNGRIPFRSLMMLDIIASNNRLDHPRPVYFLSHLHRDFVVPIADALRPLPFADLYAPLISDDDYIKILADAPARISDKIKNVGSTSHYIDPLLADQWRRQRGALVRTARSLLDNGRISDAERCCRDILIRLPFSTVSPGSFTVADSTFHEGIEFAVLLHHLSSETGNLSYRRQAVEILKSAATLARQWRVFYSSLPEWRRSSLSNDSRRLINTYPLIDSLLNKIE